MQDGDDDLVPSLAWLLHADFATGAKAFRGQGVRSSLRMVAEWEQTEGWSVGAMPGLFSDRNETAERDTATAGPGAEQGVQAPMVWLWQTN
ncbi:MAG: hypothetical protein KA375_01200 [Vitreoscilla sp.]|nr:hypothetical protein [Vitreoscilla sp.]